MDKNINKLGGIPHGKIPRGISLCQSRIHDDARLALDELVDVTVLNRYARLPATVAIVIFRFLSDARKDSTTDVTVICGERRGQMLVSFFREHTSGYGDILTFFALLLS